MVENISVEKKKKKEYTPLDRMIKAISFSRMDRIPIIFFPEWDFLADFAGISVKKLLNSVDLQIETNEKFKQRFPGVYAAVSIYKPYASAQAFGCAVSDPENEIPAVKNSIIDHPEDVYSLRVPNPWDAPGTREWLQMIQYGVDHHVQAAGNGEFGPFEVAGQVYGYDRLILHMRKRPEIVHALLEKATEFMINFFREWTKVLGGTATTTLIADHVSGFMNRKLIDEFFRPYHIKLVQGLKGYSGSLMYHSENRSGHIIDKIGEWGYNIFHGQDWEVDGSLRRTKEIVSNLGPNRYVLMGQVPGRDVMLREPSDDIVKQKIIENILIYAPGGGYVLSTGGGINRGTPLRRLDMMVELADKYGRYKNKKELYGPDEE
ncbi:MAG TPA: uroporphyrinogen decarboxylase family protein [Candidatus Deferrimicrobium sp.]|nr:uroporphyrinogen decarboxylase family protein [Candidatus Deferrimicrobium sp.]